MVLAGCEIANRWAYLTVDSQHEERSYRREADMAQSFHKLEYFTEECVSGRNGRS
jgi:hypothetical protein